MRFEWTVRKFSTLDKFIFDKNKKKLSYSDKFLNLLSKKKANLKIENFKNAIKMSSIQLIYRKKKKFEEIIDRNIKIYKYKNYFKQTKINFKNFFYCILKCLNKTKINKKHEYYKDLKILIFKKKII